jgi:hypothetical protein
MSKRPCKRCGVEIILAYTGKAKPSGELEKIPLDAKPLQHVYRIDDSGKDFTAHKAEGVHVSHFRTCPHANEFSGSKREPGEES